MVPLYRNHVLAEIKPAAKTRIAHCIEVKTLADIDTELPDWLKRAHGLDA